MKQIVYLILILTAFDVERSLAFFMPLPMGQFCAMLFEKPLITRSTECLIMNAPDVVLEATATCQEEIDPDADPMEFLVSLCADPKRAITFGLCQTRELSKHKFTKMEIQMLLNIPKCIFKGSGSEGGSEEAEQRLLSFRRYRNNSTDLNSPITNG